MDGGSGATSATGSSNDARRRAEGFTVPLVKRSSLIAILGALPLVAAPGQARAAQVYCSPTGDFCTSATLQQGARTLWVGMFSFRGKVSICVDPPRGRTTCVRKPLQSDGTIYVASAKWRRTFPNRGRGVYHVRFYYAADHNRIGPLLSFRV